MKRLYDNLRGRQGNFIFPFLWMHGEPVEEVIEEIHAIYETGIRGVCLESRTYEDFCGDNWWKDLAVIFEECKRLDMRVWILDDKHFPSGYANGIFEKKYEHLKKWDIIERHVDVMGPVTDGAVFAEDWRWDPENDEILAILACRRDENGALTSDMTDISGNVRDGMVYFDLPDGAFRIVFLVKTRFYMGKGMEIHSDKLNPAATEAYIKEVYEPHYKHFKEYFGNTFAGFFSDEPGFENNTVRGLATDLGVIWNEYPWSQSVYERLYDKYGEDTYKKLVLLWLEDNEMQCQGVRYDYMNIITDEYSKNFTQKIGEWCRAHGAEYIGHIIEDENTHAKTGRGPGHYFRAMSGQDMSGIDVVLQQIIPGMRGCSNACSTSYLETSNRFYNYVLAKLASSDAVQDNAKDGRAMCELFGAYGWAEGTKTMKFLADHMLMRGINRFVPHAFSPKEDDEDCPPTFYNKGKNPLYKYMDIIMNYINRTVNLISDAVRYTRCAILYDAEPIWCGGAFVKNEDIARELWDNLIDYDFISEDKLKEAEIKEKEIYIGSAQYKYLIVPYRKYITAELKNTLKELIKNDVCVIFAGGRPERDIYGGTAEFLGGTDCKIEDIAGLLSEVCEYEAEDKEFLAAAHYKAAEYDIYLFANESAAKVISGNIRLKNKKFDEYIIYDAVENKAYKKYGSGISLELHPYNCVAVILGNADVSLCKNKKYINEVKISPEYKISLCSDVKADIYEPYAVTSELKSITGADGIHNFGGRIKYEFEITAEKTGMYELHFEYIGECAEVYLGDELCGRRITPPHNYEIGKLCGGKKYTLTVIASTHSGYKSRDHFSRFLLFEPMGIQGNVKLCEYLYE